MSEILDAIPTLFGVPIDRLLQDRDFILLMRKIVRKETGENPGAWIALALNDGEEDLP